MRAFNKNSIKSIVVLLFLQCICWAISGQCAESRTEVPRVEAIETTYDMGYQLYWKPFSHVFQIRNVGGAPLSLDVSTRSCSCVSDILSNGVVAPGAATAIQVGYGPKAGPEKHGANSFAVVVATNDPSQKAISFTVEANLVAAIHVNPDQLEFEAGGQAKKTEKRLEIVCIPDDTLPEIISVESSSTTLVVQQVEVQATSDQIHRYLYDVSLANDAVSGGFSETVTIRSDNVRVPLIEVPILIRQKSAMVATPGAVLFGAIRSGERKEKSVALHWNDDADAPVEARSQDKRISAQLVQEAGKRSAELTVVFQSDVAYEKIQSVKANLSIFSSKGAVIAEIPVSAVVIPTR